MFKVTYQGQIHSVDTATVFDLVKSIDPKGIKEAVAAIVDDKLVDLSTILDKDASILLVAAADGQGLEVIRHSCAHLLAQAVKELFPDAQVTIGPVIEDGFYYDFSYKKGFEEADLAKIERKMKQLAKRSMAVERTTMARDEAIALFEGMGEAYKADIIRSIDADQVLSLYRQGEFIDLCRGPHVPNTRFLKAFKLTKLAGAYWRGDAKNEMLQRIYGTAWGGQDELQAYLTRIEEAKKRDHRLLAKKMGLFALYEEAPGMVFWHPRGWVVYTQLVKYMRGIYKQSGFQEVNTPQLVDQSLWERSGHWEKFSQQMFTVESDKKQYAIKPMNCPCHVKIYNDGLHSYRDLPYRLGEFGSCHRYEPSGTLYGLMRLRNFIQDDGHIFCTEAQIAQEVSSFIDQVIKVYHHFGFHKILYYVSTRPEERVGDDALWDRSEQALMDVMNQKQLQWTLQEGEGAFYGPKIEFSLEDCLGRIWQCGTVQIDFSMPERLQAHYIDESGNKQTPVMIHRAILGSLERFIGILIENTAGMLPFWMAPVHLVVANITSAQEAYVTHLAKELRGYGLRVELDCRNEKIGYKIRQHAIARVPYIVVCGDREVEAEQMTVRNHRGDDLGVYTLQSWIDFLSKTHQTSFNSVTNQEI
jgi:threonyl-tRNA synthetase